MNVKHNNNLYIALKRFKYNNNSDFIIKIPT